MVADDIFNHDDSVVLVGLLIGWKELREIKVELSVLFRHVGSYDAGLHKGVSSIDEHIVNVVHIDISGSQVDKLTISQDHLLLSQSSSVMIVRVDLTEIKTLLWSQFLFELLLF